VGERGIFLVVAYDVVSTMRRTHLVKFLKHYGRRVNYSVFEVKISPEKMEILSNGIRKRINPKKDCVLIYELCSTCLKKRTCLGVSKTDDTPAVVLF